MGLPGYSENRLASLLANSHGERGRDVLPGIIVEWMGAGRDAILMKQRSEHRDPPICSETMCVEDNAPPGQQTDNKRHERSTGMKGSPGLGHK